jgi:hypothetical protein
VEAAKIFSVLILISSLFPFCSFSFSFHFLRRRPHFGEGVFAFGPRVAGRPVAATRGISHRAQIAQFLPRFFVQIALLTFSRKSVIMTL